MENREKITNRFLATSLRIFSGEELTNGVCKKKKRKEIVIERSSFLHVCFTAVEFTNDEVVGLFRFGTEQQDSRVTGPVFL